MDVEYHDRKARKLFCNFSFTLPFNSAITESGCAAIAYARSYGPMPLQTNLSSSKGIRPIASYLTPQSPRFNGPLRGRLYREIVWFVKTKILPFENVAPIEALLSKALSTETIIISIAS